MTLTRIFYVVAAVILFLGGIGAKLLPNAVLWGLFCVTLGLLLEGRNFNFQPLVKP